MAPPAVSDHRQEIVDRAIREANRALAQGDYDTARNAATQALSADPTNRQAVRLLQDIADRQKAENDRNGRAQRIDEVRQAIRRGDTLKAESLALELRNDYPSDRAIASLVAELQRKKQNEMNNMRESDSRKVIERQVVLAYYGGKYEAVIALVDQNLSDYPNSWILQLYEGCAHAALSLLDDKNQKEHLQQAQALFRRAKASPGFSTPPEISPKIIEILKNS